MDSQRKASFRQTIRQKYESLSPGQRVLADIFLGEDRDIAFLSGAQLAKKLGTNRSSLVRFAQALGYTGFPDLQRDVQSTIKEELKPSNALTGSLEEIGTNGQRVYSALKHAVDIDLEALRSLSDQITEQKFEKAVDIITSSERIFIFGLGAGESLASFLSFRLRRYGWDVHTLDRGGSILHDHLLLFGETSSLVAFGFHRYPKELSIVLEHARECQMPAVLVTDDPNCPYANVPEVVLTGSRGRFGIMHSLAVPMTISHALALGVSIRYQDKTLAILEALEELRDRFDSTSPLHKRVNRCSDS